MDHNTTGTATRLVNKRVRSRTATLAGELRGELVRKSLHMLIAFVPSIATMGGVGPTLALLATGVLFYAGAEYVRLQGGSIGFITTLTVVASRPRDWGRFVLGPVTLGVGAMLALLLYPAPAAFLAIYALAFGDGLASVVGKLFGSIEIVGGKTVEGSLACFVAVFAVAIGLTRHFGAAVLIAGTATVLELLPASDMDNVVLPIGVGLMATFLLVP